ncbi:MAG: radical SAM protein [Desulfobacterales bacterium]|nr:radical SAM protein [Desulfobacterales bacterium]
MLVLSAPVHYTLELTPSCNNRCIGCGNVSFSHKSDLSTSSWQNIVNAIHPHAVHIRISGGEPTLHPEFESIIKIFADLDISFTLFTNGRWRNPDRLIHFLSEIPQCKGLLISLHGHNSHIHDTFTSVRGSFSETVQNIQKAAKAGFTIATSTIITCLNFSYVRKIIKFSEELGAYQATFSRYVTVRTNDYTPDPEQLQIAVEAIEDRRNTGSQAEYSVCIPQCFTPSSSTGCLSGITYCVIDPQGNIRPCTHVPIICGNILEQDVEEIWHGNEMQSWRDIIPYQCHHCIEFSKCRGGCRAMATLNNLKHDPLMKRPLTESKETHEKFVLYEGAKPMPAYTIRSEPFGYILLKENHVIPVSYDAKSILDMLDGTVTLKQIKQLFGQNGLEFIGHLYQEGMVDL